VKNTYLQFSLQETHTCRCSFVIKKPYNDAFCVVTFFIIAQDKQ